jgi:hypothetical protein
MQLGVEARYIDINVVSSSYISLSFDNFVNPDFYSPARGARFAILFVLARFSSSFKTAASIEQESLLLTGKTFYIYFLTQQD